MVSVFLHIFIFLYKKNQLNYSEDGKIHQFLKSRIAPIRIPGKNISESKDL